MKLMTNIKYSLMNRPLGLKKTLDYCPSKKPRLTVIFLHGIASSSDAFKNTIKYLVGTTSMHDIRFVTFDLLGAGKSYTSDKLNYSVKEQIDALHNSISKLKISTPLILVGHSMGSLIALNYVNTYKKSIKELVMVSPPLYTKKDLEHPAFKEAVKGFEKLVSAKHKGSTEGKQFNSSMNNIVLTDQNYKVISKITTKTIIIYGELDQFILSYNIPVLLKLNPKHLSAIKTIGAHPMSRDKYHKLVPILEEAINEAI